MKLVLEYCKPFVWTVTGFVISRGTLYASIFGRWGNAVSMSKYIHAYDKSYESRAMLIGLVPPDRHRQRSALVDFEWTCCANSGLAQIKHHIHSLLCQELPV